MNYAGMALWSDNNELFKEITKDWQPGNISSIDQFDKDGKACIVITAQYLPFVALEKLSALHPEMTFMASCHFDHEAWEREYLYEFKAGDERFVRVEANYFWPVLKGTNEGQDSVTGSMGLPDKKTVNRLRTKIEEVFRRIDVITGEGEEMDINFYEGEVSVTAEDGDWKMKATKMRSQVNEVKVYEKKCRYVWEEVHPSFDVDDDTLLI